MVALAFAVSVCAFAAEATKKTFKLPAGDAAVTLKRFSEQSGEQIVYPVDAVRGVQTNAVNGEFAASDALDRLVAGTELRIVRDEKTGAIAVNRIAAVSGNGSIEGRVFNPASNTYVNNARVTIDAHRLETFTDESGNYRFPRVPAGDATVRVFYTGFPPETQIVKVSAGQSAAQDFSLRGKNETSTDKTVKLDAFTVAANRDMAASDIAVNEQRYSTAIKNVVSTDSFGDIAEGNVGEFAKFLPGVTLNRNGSDGFSISVGGVPSGGTPIMVDGNPLSSAASSGGSRTVELEQVSITTMSRVEVNRSPSPDAPANNIGGTVNLITKSAFERRRPEYVIKSYISFKGGDFSFSKEPNPFAKNDYQFEPNGEFSAIVPVTKNFGFTASGLVTRALNNGQGSLQTWTPTASLDTVNLTSYRLQERPKITVRESISLGADWRVTPHDILSAGFQYAYFKAKFWVRQLNFSPGTVASSGPDFTQGANGSGTIQTIYDAREKAGTTYVPSFKWRHNGPVWEWQFNGAFSNSTNYYRNLDKGYFQTNNALLRNVTVRFEKLTYDHPEIITVRNATNTADVDPYVLSNYKLEGLTSNRIDGFDTVRSVSGYARRTFDLRLPIIMKVGTDLSVQRRDIGNTTYDTTFVGADRVGQTADDVASQWMDPVYSTRNLLFGNQKMQWMDLNKIGSTFLSNPGYFNQTETNQVNGYRSTVNNSKVINEELKAFYVRFDTRLFNGRLQLSGGVRYESTDDRGAGPLIDLTRTYSRDASGKVILDAAGKPVIAASVATLAGTKLAYVHRGTTVEESYDGYFPSFSANYNIMPDLIARASYGRSISRPEFNDIFPSANLPDPAGATRIITLTNPGLKPWYANSYGLALEYYFNQPSSGVVSTRFYRRDITDFWATQVGPANRELLETYGIDPDIYGESQGFQTSTKYNVGSTRIYGTEFDYRQNLAFLPHWARGLTVFGNLTMQHIQGSEGASFSNFVAKTANFGVTYSRQRLTLRIAVNQKGTVRQGQVTGTNREPGTFQYISPRRSADFSAEYRLTQQFSVFVGGRNINEAVDDTVVYGPNTRGDRILTGRADYRAYWNVGVKGTF